MKVKSITEHEQADACMPGLKNVKMRMLVGPQDGARNFHMRHFEVGVGGHTPHHQHDYEHEILILAGQGALRSDAGDHALRSGDVVWVPPNAMHQFINTGAEALQFICLIPAPQDCAR